MKIRLLLLSLLFSLVSASALQAQPKPEKEEGEEETELGDKMDRMGGAFRKLKRQAADASKNEESLKLVATIRESAEASTHLEPARKADIPADAQAKFVTDYQAKMKETLAVIDELAAAFKAGNNEEAGKLIAKLGEAQKAGHKEFKRPSKKK